LFYLGIIIWVAVSYLTWYGISSVSWHKNSRRYEWLRKQHWSTSNWCVSQPSRIKMGADCPSGDRLDALIDTLMSSKTRTP
jgi:hypothetical protein